MKIGNTILRSQYIEINFYLRLHFNLELILRVIISCLTEVAGEGGPDLAPQLTHTRHW